MKLGIYKVGPKICFHRNDDDHSAISTEVTQVVKLLAKGGHKVHILSDNDYIEDSIKNVSRDTSGTFDKVFVYNGVGPYKEILPKLRLITKSLNLIVTDIALIPDPELMEFFDEVFTQSSRYHTYGHIEEQEAFGYEPHRHVKKIQIYFGGTERKRSKDFFEYVYRPNVLWCGKSETLGIKQYVPYHQHVEYMKQAKYSIVIGDETYNKIGFITPRYYECLRYDVIAFVDHAYDPDELVIKHDDYRRVKNFAEMMEKIKMFESDKSLYHRCLNAQREQMTPDLINGTNILNALTK